MRKDCTRTVDVVVPKRTDPPWLGDRILGAYLLVVCPSKFHMTLLEADNLHLHLHHYHWSFFYRYLSLNQMVPERFCYILVLSFLLSNVGTRHDLRPSLRSTISWERIFAVVVYVSVEPLIPYFRFAYWTTNKVIVYREELRNGPSTKEK